MIKEVGAIKAFENTTKIDDYIAKGGYEGLKKAIKMNPKDIVSEVKNSGLRGRGGAGFPTGIKWESVPEADEVYVVCNADEGEPGTFKDRFLLEKSPHLVIEGMIIAGVANGSNQGYIYIRGEYMESIPIFQTAIDEAKAKNLLGDKILGSNYSYDLEIKVGAGAYVVGEETALLNSLLGYRGNPWPKPPYPTVRGLWDKPTLVNNVETFACVSLILKNGSAWFAGIGSPDSPGPKLYCVSGHVLHPGVYEYPMGTKLGDILNVARVKGELKAIQLGGKAGPVYRAKLSDCAPVLEKDFWSISKPGSSSVCVLDVTEFKLDFAYMRRIGGSLGSGAVIVMNESTDIIDALASITRFFEEESCGKCSPCRLGTFQINKMVEDMEVGNAKMSYIPLIIKTLETMKIASFCPLGQSLIAPVKGVLDNFKDEIEASIKRSVYVGGQHG